MTEAIIHIGLHKTGTTSFQIGCSQSHQLLRDNGVLYPLDELSTIRSDQHQGIVHRLMSGGDPIAEARRLAQLSHGAPKLLLSAEDFSNFFGLDQLRPAAKAFFGELNSQFRKVTYYCVIREDRPLVISTIREMIDMDGVPLYGRKWIEGAVIDFYNRNMELKNILGGQINVLVYEELCVGNLTRNLLKECAGIDLEMPDTCVHTSGNKDFRYVLMSNVRKLLFHGLKAKTPYTKEVNDAYEKAFISLSMEPSMEKTLSSMFHSWLATEVDHAMSRVDRNLRQIYGIQPHLQSAD